MAESIVVLRMLYDAVVVGLGGVGSFALRALSKKGGGKYLGVERFQRCHSRGSSHGKSRIYRRAYFEHPSYVPWIEFSLDVFRSLEGNVMQECGNLLVEPSTGNDTVEDLPPLCRSSYGSALQYNIPVEYLTPMEMKERFPQFCYNHEMVGLLEPHAGFLRPELCMQAALKEAETFEGIDVWESTTVKSYTSLDADTLEVVLVKDGETVSVQTKWLLISAGGWARELLPSWNQYAVPHRQLQGWIDVSSTDDPSLYGYKKMPTWVLCTPDWPLPFYGLPADLDDPDYCTKPKLGIHCRDAEIKDLIANESTISSREMVELQEATTHALADSPWKDLPGPIYAEAKSCIYTMTPDAHFMIGSPAKNVFAVGGLSGHGFKMVPALGQMMADFASDEDLRPWKLDFCSPSRFGLVDHLRQEG